MKNVITKLEESSCVDILLTDRGTQFGYNNLVADMRSIPLMQELVIQLFLMQPIAHNCQVVVAKSLQECVI